MDDLVTGANSIIKGIIYNEIKQILGIAKFEICNR